MLAPLYVYPLRTILVFDFVVDDEGGDGRLLKFTIRVHEEMWSFADMIAALCVAVFAWTDVLEPERSPDFSEVRVWLEERPWLAGDEYQGPMPERAVLEADRQEFKALIARAIDRGGSTERKLSLVPAHGFAQLGWITNLFLHFSLGHLLGNLAFLWVVGPLLEEAWGRRRFLVFYLAAGLVASLAQFLISPRCRRCWAASCPSTEEARSSWTW